MKICKNDYLKEIKSIIASKAKYQKVMLLFDDNVSNIEIAKIYETIKELCVYNQSNIKHIDEEIFNGYRLIIYYCTAESFLKCSFNRDEFINIFLPKNDALLPYFLNDDNTISSRDDYLIVENNNVDFSMLASINFNMFYNYFYNLTLGKYVLPNFVLAQQEITQNSVINLLSNINGDVQFLDVDIIKQAGIAYDKIILVDLLIIDAFLLLITAIKNKNVLLVDVYKSSKEDFKLLDKLYKMYYDETFVNLVIINYNCLFNFCVKTKEKIKELLCFCDIEKEDIDKLINAIKIYAQNSEGLIAYMYLYNIFGS